MGFLNKTAKPLTLLDGDLRIEINLEIGLSLPAGLGPRTFWKKK